MVQNRYPKEVVLKDGREVILKILGPKDREGLAHFYENMPLSYRWLFKEDPCDPLTLEKWLKYQEQGRSFGILATFEERIVGHAAILRQSYGAGQHIGRLQVMVSPEFRSLRLGTWLVFDLTRRAMDFGLEKLRADFVVGVEDLAIEAAIKMDFVKEGLLSDYILDEEGNYHDYQIMIKNLHKEWSDF